MNLEVTVFQEGVSLPLGSTSPLTIGQLIDQLGPEMQEMFPLTDGAYAFAMSDKFDLSEQLAFLSENFSLFAETFQFCICFKHVHNCLLKHYDGCCKILVR